MTKLTKAQTAERDEARAKLRGMLRVGSTVYTTLRNVSRSGMSRDISLHIVEDGAIRDITWLAARATGDRMAPGNEWAIRVGGVGMDMGFAVVYGLSRALWPNGHQCTGSNGRTKSGNISSVPRCPSNDHTNDYGRLAREYDAAHADEYNRLYIDPEEAKAKRTEYVSARQEWIANQRTYTKTRHHADSGYVLSQSWM